jgi:acyl-CoA thioesterase FadM
MMTLAFQDYYPDDVSHCYGCGSLNEHGYQLKTYWDGDESVTRFQPRPYHTAIPGYVYGGLIASMIDCHSTGTAAAALYRAENRDPDSLPTIRCLTGSLHVDYLKPTPLGPELEIRGTVKDISGRRVTIISSLYAEGLECCRGEVVAVQVSDSYIKKLLTGESG